MLVPQPHVAGNQPVAKGEEAEAPQAVVDRHDHHVILKQPGA